MRHSLSRLFATVVPKIQMADLKANPLLNFVVTSDFYRVDVGVILCRRPIFFDLEEPEFEQISREHALRMKNNLYGPFPKELGSFNRTEVESPPLSPDETPTHFRKNADGSVSYHRPASKMFKYVQPDIFDPHHLHSYGIYNVFYLVKQKGQWRFPQTPATMDSTLNNTKTALMSKLTGNEFSILFSSKYPLCVQRSTIPQSELEQNQYMSKCVGRKVFYYQAYHDSGLTKQVHDAEDYAWVPKPLLNKYLNKEDFEAVLPHLKEIKA